MLSGSIIRVVLSKDKRHVTEEREMRTRRSWLAVGLLMLLGWADQASAGPPSDEWRRLYEQLVAYDSVADIGFDPWNDQQTPEGATRLWRMVVEKLKPLAICAATKRGTLGEVVPGEGDLGDLRAYLMRFGLDFDTVQPQELFTNRGFMEDLKLRSQELAFLCGRAIAPGSPEQLGLAQCFSLCSTSFGACYGTCQAFGPPEPSCISQCEWRQFACDLLCAIGNY